MYSRARFALNPQTHLLFSSCHKMTYLLLLQLGLFVSGISFTRQNCRQMYIIPYTSKQGQVDPFGVTDLVRNHFQQQGFAILSAPLSTIEPACQYYQCRVSHTENYWQFKRDSVYLTISDQTGNVVGRFYGVSGKTALTFRSGYATATTRALRNAEQFRFYR